MAKVKFFYVSGCPYCAQARKAREELIQDIADRYDYYATPAMFVNEEKIYEAHIGEKYDEAKENVKKVMDAALHA